MGGDSSGDDAPPAAPPAAAASPAVQASPVASDDEDDSSADADPADMDAADQLDLLGSQAQAEAAAAAGCQGGTYAPALLASYQSWMDTAWGAMGSSSAADAAAGPSAA